MNDGREAQSIRGVPDEASANTLDAMSPVPHKTPLAENQSTRLQAPLSLRIDGLNATVSHSEGNPTLAYESSERGSDTSLDGRRPDLHSASTLTDSLFSYPSSTNGADQPTHLDNSHNSNEHTSISRMEQEPQDTHMAPHTQPVNGGSIDRWQPSLPSIKAGNTSLSPPPSPKHSHSRSQFDAGLAPGQKRTAAGDYKSNIDIPKTHSTDTNGVARRRSKSTGSSLYGSRIAQLSVHIRSRLSYAAAKVEQSRQSQSRGSTPQNTLRTQHSTSSLSPSAPSDIASLPAGASTPFSINSQSSSNGHSHPSHSRSRSAFLSDHLPPNTKLAPPVDIILSNGQGQRRRPNPNSIVKPSSYSPVARHRRHHSYQENGLSRPLNGTALGPETPSLPSTQANGPTSTPNGLYGGRTPSENTLMEQDAIETLMFMSSPENSGYRFSPRPMQPPSTQSSLSETLMANNESNRNGNLSSQSSRSHNSRGFDTKPGMEAGAGDDIDRLLDQMNSDSEDEGRYESIRRGINGAHPFRHAQRPR
ncbi:unnamed protein product [Penicillium salamii]|uniref:Uncharacterized protein n=1 Tax=Penicillium salamii TaxID=1612424 RepID=A0A9W4JB52_9EURO|nr:unnamed protein product [Penicillium salamii]CAG8124990.1 unnamed protein product [Penicillium salamii]CAG8224685.1 unnamed protein product [Penicillium salamii]CAG8305966.1 unnamed protein product [Penicillium salamii]CAG8327950.1 unnamed protein product [Penicillium salamii]